MRHVTAQRVLPTIGFGLTILINLLYTWGDWVFISSVAIDFQSLLLFWSIPHLLASALIFLLITLISNRVRPWHFWLFCSLAALFMISGHVLQHTSVLPQPEVKMALTGLCIGAGTSFLFTSWIMTFSDMSYTSNRMIIILALAFSAVFFMIVSYLPLEFFDLISLALTLLAIAMAVAAMLVCSPSSYLITHDPESATQTRPSLPILPSIILLRSPLFCAASIVFAVPLTRVATLVDGENNHLINIVTSLVIIIIVVVFLALRFRIDRSGKILRYFDVPSLFVYSLPVVATALVLYTIFGRALALPTSVVVSALFYLVWLLLIPTCIETARKLGTSPLLCYGIVGFVVNLVFALGTGLSAFLLAGSLFFGAATLGVCMLLVLYVLMMTFTFKDKRVRALDEEGISQKQPFPVLEKADENMSGPPLQNSHDSVLTQQQRDPGVVKETVLELALFSTERVCKELSKDHQLTPRESDILLLMVNGRNTPYISSQLFISKNTVRTHIKNIYIKIDVHSKQELLDLLQTMLPGSENSE